MLPNYYLCEHGEVGHIILSDILSYSVWMSLKIAAWNN